MNLIDWLLQGDVSIRFQTKRDLLDIETINLSDEQRRITAEGWGMELLKRRDSETGMWGRGIYSPKWISTHYTLLDLKYLGILPSTPQYVESSKLLLKNLWFNKGKVRSYRFQDLCMSAMVLSICTYTKILSPEIFEIVDYLLEKQLPDGGWNCRWDKGDKVSSVHSTLSTLEALRDFINEGYDYRIEEIENAVYKAQELLLKRNLFKSLSTGDVIDRRFIMLSFPSRWKYDILRCLDYFQSVNKDYDSRMEEALGIIMSKRRKDNKWPVQEKHSGLVHFDMEKTGGESRWNTLRALRVMKKYRKEFYFQIVEDKILTQIL